MKAKIRSILGKAVILSLILMMTCIFSSTDSFAAAKKPTKITLKATSKTVDIKGKVTVSVKSVTPSNASKSVSYKSSNTKVAKVSTKGVVTGVKKGTATITATSKVNKKIKAAIKVTVKDMTATSVALNKSKASVLTGKSVTLKATVKGKTGFYNQGVTWSTSDKAVATVSSKGVVTGVKAGTATITAKEKGGSKKAVCSVTVTDPPKKKALVIYFARGENIVDADEYSKTLGDDIDAMTSASVLPNESGEITGNIGILADWIADALETKTYSIRVKTPYPQLKKETQQIVLNQEQMNGILPEIEAYTEDLSQYDIIYLGFPNWYGEPPRALYTFLNENDLDGKTIVPFTSDDRNGFSDSIDILKAKLPHSAVLDDGLLVNRKDLLSSKDVTLEWVEKISKEAENAEANPLATAAAQKEAAKKLIGQSLTKEEVMAAVGKYSKFVTDTNG